MDKVFLSKDNYDTWNEFVLKTPDAWFWHTTKWLDYSIIYNQTQSLSFMVTENSEVMAICPLLLKDDEFVMFWSPAFVEGPRREKAMAETFEEIDRLASEHNVKRASFMIYPLSFPEHNYLMKFGYADISLNTQVIDLSLSLSNLHRGLRKGHDYDIDRGLKILDTVTMSGICPRDYFEAYCNLHHKDAGRVTRPQSTWDMQYDWIRSQDAMLVGAYTDEEKFVGFSYVFTHKGLAYYGSACSDPDYTEAPVGHLLNWKTIEVLKDKGFEYYEIGQQPYCPQPYDFPTEKELSIAKFKRGFGGIALPLFRGEKYYSSEYYTKVSADRVDKYATYLRGKHEPNS